jgi:hypothetical protein
MARQVLVREKVYDPVLRILHAWNGLAILLLVISSLVAEALRILAGGNRPLAFSRLDRLCTDPGPGGPREPGASTAPACPPVRPVAVAGLVACRAQPAVFTEPDRFGHHPLASGAYLAFYLVVWSWRHRAWPWPPSTRGAAP